MLNIIVIVATAMGIVAFTGLAIIVIVATAMGIVAFTGLAYQYALHLAYEVAILDLYILFASGVGLGVCLIGLYNAILEAHYDRG